MATLLMYVGRMFPKPRSSPSGAGERFGSEGRISRLRVGSRIRGESRGAEGGRRDFHPWTMIEIGDRRGRTRSAGPDPPLGQRLNRELRYAVRIPGTTHPAGE